MGEYSGACLRRPNKFIIMSGLLFQRDGQDHQHSPEKAQLVIIQFWHLRTGFRKGWNGAQFFPQLYGQQGVYWSVSSLGCRKTVK